MKNPKRTRVATGIYSDACGYSATVSQGGLRKDQRFPPGTAVAFMERWRLRTRADLADAHVEPAPDDPAPVRGTFAADVTRYLPQIKGRVGWKADRSHLHAWLPAIGKLTRTRITVAHIRTAVAGWLGNGKSARTVRHRVRVVRELYQALDGRHARPPLEGVKLPRPADPSPTPVSLATIQAVALSLSRGLTGQKRHGPTRTIARTQYAKPAKTHARFLVRATTGQRPAQIMRAEPEDVDLDRAIWFVRAAKGGTVIPLPLNDDMVQAWQAFAAAQAWGTFDARTFSKTIRRHGWPKGIRPYTLRHTFAIDHLLGGTDLGDLQGLLGHRQIDTTRKFYGPILLARLKKASASRSLKLA